MSGLALLAFAVLVVGLFVTSYQAFRLDVRVRSLERSRDVIETAAERVGRALEEQGETP